MAKDESRRNRCVEVSKKLRNGFQMVAVSCYMMVLFAQPAAAADTMWTRFSTIIADVYGELVGISTIVAVTAAAVAEYRQNYLADLEGKYLDAKAKVSVAADGGITCSK